MKTWTRLLNQTATEAFVQNTAVLKPPSHQSIKSVGSSLADGEQQSSGRSLYRALLRESTYIPDAAARKYLPLYIEWRFRNAIRKRRLAESEKPVSRGMKFPVLKDASNLQSDAQLDHNSRRIQSGLQGLRRLRQANAGHLRPLVKVLEMTYGRTGRRRHEILNKINIPLKTVREHSDIDIGHLAPQLHSLLTSSGSSNPGRRSSRMVRTRPEVPELNAWGRRMPQKRARNLRQKWYAKLLQQVHLPLPEGEWEKLRRLATGEEEADRCRPRRKPAKGQVHLENFDASQTWHQSSDMRMSSASKPYRTSQGISRPHTLRPRLMRRIYAEIFRRTPKLEVMEEDGHPIRKESKGRSQFADGGKSGGLAYRQQWRAVWADADEGKMINTTGKWTSDWMFAGVDDAGKVLTDANQTQEPDNRSL